MSAGERSDVLSLFDALDGLAAQATTLRAEGKAQKKQVRLSSLLLSVFGRFLPCNVLRRRPKRPFYGSGTKYWRSFCNTVMLDSSRPGSSTNGWPTHRVRAFGIGSLTDAAVICEEHHGEYIFAIETYRAFVGKKRSPDLLGMATALFAYCNTHRLDPDNSLIGATFYDLL